MLAAQKHSRLCHHRRHLFACASLPSIRDFIKNECPVKGFDGSFREQTREATINTACIGVEASHLVVPGQRRLYKVSNQTLEQIVADQGQVMTADQVVRIDSCRHIVTPAVPIAYRL
jgi:hypothetical protein